MRVQPPALGSWLIRHMRDTVRAEGVDVEVGPVEPDDLSIPRTRPLIVIREDPGARLDWTTFDRSVGITVLAGTKQLPTPADELARLVAAIAFDSDLPLVEGSPIAAVNFDGCRGPFDIVERLDIARRYLTAQYVVTGSW